MNLCTYLLAALVKVVHFSTSLPEQFRHLLKGVEHERPDVRLHALKALHKLLKSNRVGACQFCIVLNST